jgi:8-oxo-dGTP pyrophosphatase MutT (NUDIX family)
MSYPFNIRVYGILWEDDRVLVSDERIGEDLITKFPGGGLEYGEGLKDCLKREIREEMGSEVIEVEHYYTTDFFQQSWMHDEPNQVVSIYFLFRLKGSSAFELKKEGNEEGFRWLDLRTASTEAMSLPIDRYVLEMILRER